MFIRNNRHALTTRLLPALLPLLPCIGCQNAGKINPQAPDHGHRVVDVRSDLPIFNRSGSRVRWNNMVAAATNEDVVIIGEQHDDAVGHNVELAFVEDAVKRWPDTTLSMEMLDRRKQSATDDYVAGIIDRDDFIREVASTKFRRIARSYLDGDIDRARFERRIFAVGWPDWPHNYQPIIDVAREHDMPILASNTPWLHYAKLANKEGFERLASLTPAQRALVEVPGIIPQDDYRDRFFEVMTPSSEGDDEAASSVHGSGNNDVIEGAFRAQCVMDATMADSIADALNARPGRVVHLVGQFHSDFNGGIVQQLRHLRPQTRVMTISMQSTASSKLQDDDRDRADFVVYTGGDAD